MAHDVKWKASANCLGDNVELYFDGYEEHISVRPFTDAKCMSCPVQRMCLAHGVGGKEYGLWGGIYLEEGEISDYNNHKTKEDWNDLWMRLTMK